MCKERLIRIASEDDAEKLLEIYAFFVEHTAITFEYEVPTLAEFRKRIRYVLRRYPYLAAEVDGTIVGYAYAGPFKERAAYDWAVETTVYVERAYQKMGIGRMLYDALEEVLRKQHILNVNACIAYPEQEDLYLDQNSVEYHAHMGYRMVGKFHNCGYKFGHWYHMVWMEKELGVHPENPKAVLWFPQVRSELGW